jgi:hypothetical protein
MTKYIRRPAVFNKNSQRELRIWNWIVNSTDNFEKQNFAAFVRDKLEWCMQNESGSVQTIEPKQHQNSPETEAKKDGWASLV